MHLQPRGFDKIVQLLDKGVNIPNPLSVDIGDEVDPARISGEGVAIFPGCRLYGSKTVISAGARLGAEAPATVDGCRLGPGVELKGGYFKDSVFLEKANMGSGAQVREACLLEEEAGGAHCVGLKQTILFPFVTLGSLINFCDCFMAGGTSRKDHSEVGSSYIHFNFTPDGDKTTPSLFGDVPRGVMLDQPPIFLGGQGGAVGPVRVGFGTVVAAGSVLRDDILDDGLLIVPDAPHEIRRRHSPYAYRNLTRVVRSNVAYLANLAALERWYREIRQPFFARQELGPLIYEGAMETLALAKDERTKRLLAMAGKAPTSDPTGEELRTKATALCAVFSDESLPAPEEAFLNAVRAANETGTGYVTSVQRFTPEIQALGVEWLERIVNRLGSRADELLTTMDVFPLRR